MSSGRGIPEYRGPMSARSELSLLVNRLECMMLPGKVAQIDYLAGYARVEMLDKKDAGVTTDWIRWMENTAGEDREWSPPSIGENVLVYSPTGNLNNGIIWGAFNTTKLPPISDSGTIRRKTWGKPPDGSFFDYLFWEVEKRKGREHVWNYAPKTGEFRQEVGDKSLFHQTADFIMLKVGNTQLLMQDGSITMTVAEDLKNPMRASEVRMTRDHVEIHASHEASVVVKRSNAGGEAAVTSQVGMGTVLEVKKQTMKASVYQNTCLTLTAFEAVMEVKNAKSKLSLKGGITSLAMDGVSMYLTPVVAGLGKAGSELLVGTGVIVHNTTSFISPPISNGYFPGAGRPFVTGPTPAVPASTIPVVPRQAKPRWTMKESKKAPYYPRSQKPKK